MNERVQKILAAAGIASRRKCEQLIAEKRVTVDGKTIKLGDKADPAADDIRVDGERVRAERKRYYAVNKPRGVVSTVSDPFGRRTVVHLVPQGARVFPVGRLDRDAEGLVLLTNDGALANRITHPRYGVKKTYEATLSRDMAPADFTRLQQGILIDGRRVRVTARMRSPQNVVVSLHEGRKHVVKRLFRVLGYGVRRLRRTSIGTLALGGIPSGRSRELSRRELADLRRLVQLVED